MKRSTLLHLAMVALAAQLPGQAVRENWWITTGTVSTIVENPVNDRIYLGGFFSGTGADTPNGVVLSGSTGYPVAAGSQPNNSVSSCIPDGNGGWFIGGTFSEVGGYDRQYLAKINADGSVAAWNGVLDVATYGGVHCLALSGGVLFVGGNFSMAGGQPRAYLAAFDAATGTLLPWAPSASSQVFALEVVGNTVYAGGWFITMNGVQRRRLAALDATTGNVLPWNPDAGLSVNCLAVQGNTVFVGGEFNTMGSVPRQFLAAVDATTGALLPWNPGTDGYQVHDLLVSGNTLYVAGELTSVGGQPRTHLAAVDATTGALLPFAPSISGYGVNGLSLSGNNLYLAGQFSTVGGQTRNNLAAVDASTGTTTTFTSNLGGYGTYSATGYAVAASGTQLYVGGWFRMSSFTQQNNLAVLDASSGRPLPWSTGTDLYGSVHDMELVNNTLYVGGWFTTIGGAARSRIAALDATTGAVLPWNPGTNTGVLCLATLGNTVYAGGWFDQAAGQPRNGLAAFDGATGALLPWDPNADNGFSYMTELVAIGNSIYVGGNFSAIGGQARPNLAAVDALTGAVLPWNPAPNSVLTELKASGPVLFVGGFFSSIAGATRNRLAAFNTTTGALLGWNPDVTGSYVDCLERRGGLIAIGGSFTHVGGVPRNNLAILGTNGQPLAVNPAPDNVVASVAWLDGGLLVSGPFVQIGSTAQPFLAYIERKYSAADARSAPLEPVPALAGTGLAVWPNPAKDHITLQWPALAQGDGTATVELLDLLGQRIAAWQVPLQPGAGQYPLDLAPEFPPGAYLLRARIGDQESVARLLLH